VVDLEEALLSGRADIAVHSAKDVPGEMAAGLEIAAVPERADPRDALCGAGSLEELAPGARIGTSSLRRRAQLLALRDDLEVVSLRGNVDTRLRRLAEGDLAGLVLALAGLERLGRRADAGAVLDEEQFVPAPGQGALAIQARMEDARVRTLVGGLDDPSSSACLRAERALTAGLRASCHTPVGARARFADGNRGPLVLQAFVGMPDGSQWVRDRLAGDGDHPEQLGRAVADRLLAAGAGDILDALAAAPPGEPSSPGA
jgi:hydroxymethylbilane synthase